MSGKMKRSGLSEIIPLMCTSAVWGQHPVFSHPESLQGAHLGRLQWLRACLHPDLPQGSSSRSLKSGGLMAAASLVYWCGGNILVHRSCSSPETSKEVQAPILFWQETLPLRTLRLQTCLSGFCHHKHSLAYRAFAHTKFAFCRVQQFSGLQQLLWCDMRCMRCAGGRW